uniref:Uncharacterized protein n=1 Tax=Glossina morsitans morsitans TaxID=37546 RepID=A0A1B0FA43_GLOMM
IWNDKIKLIEEDKDKVIEDSGKEQDDTSTILSEEYKRKSAKTGAEKRRRKVFNSIKKEQEPEESQQDFKLLQVINLTAVAIKRLIKMAKKTDAFRDMCQEDQVALLKEPESRDCVQCYLILMECYDDSAPRPEVEGENSHTKALSNTPLANTATCSSPPITHSPNPNNPMEYCSTISPHKQVSGEHKYPPSVIVPVGVLKKDNAGSHSSNSSNSSGQKARKRKSVMFSDGIAAGSDLAIIDQWNKPKQPRRQSERIHQRQSNSNNIKPPTPGGRAEQITDASTLVNKVMAEATPILANTSSGKSNDANLCKPRLPPSGCDEFGCFIPEENDHSLPPIILFRNESGYTLKFTVQTNFPVYVKIVNLKCCLNRTVSNFTTKGMHHVGNDEIIISLECDIPASKEELHNPLIPKDVFVHLNEIYNHANKGNRIAELSHTSPADVIVPENPYLIGILIHRKEVPWAKVFPLRLMLRLGAQYRYYPCPQISMCNREPVNAEIAQTIINFLADLRNYSYTLPFIHGMYIHMEDRQTTVVIPRNRLEDVVKAINNSSDHILAFGGNFSKTADCHLVDGGKFFVLNESLKASSGLSGKCSVVEDGLMVQVLPAKMEDIRNALKNQNDVTIVCGPYDEWYDSASTLTPIEITLLTQQIARSTSIALVPFLDLLTAS